MHVRSGGAASLWGFKNICVSSKCSCYCGQNAARRLTQKGLLVLLQNDVCLSAYTSLSRSIFGSPATHSIKRGQQILEIFLPSHSKKSIQVSGDSPACPLVTAGAHQGCVDLHLCPLSPPQNIYSEYAFCFICALFARSALLATQDQIKSRMHLSGMVARCNRLRGKMDGKKKETKRCTPMGEAGMSGLCWVQRV